MLEVLECSVYPWSVQLMLVTLSHYDLSPPHFSKENTNISNLSSAHSLCGINEVIMINIKTKLKKLIKDSFEIYVMK